MLKINKMKKVVENIFEKLTYQEEEIRRSIRDSDRLPTEGEETLLKTLLDKKEIVYEIYKEFEAL